MKIEIVGFGTTAVGPITGTGTSTLVQVKRGVVGSAATSHSAGDEVRIYKGSYNISGRNIHFVDPPRGNSQIKRDASNLEPEKADFTGRVYLRNNYDTNQIYDDISDQFTGIGATFTLTVGGANTTGIGSTGGNGILFINGIFQTPSSPNNPDNNFALDDYSTAGITSVIFSGITSADGSKYVTSTDYNSNQLPRGGVIVSLGSSGGLGYAPLVGAAVTATVSAGGTITGLSTALTGGSLGSGYNGLVSIGVSVYESGHTGAAATITATANVGAGGTLSFTIVGGGSGYSAPQIIVSEPTYEGLTIEGVSRLGFGQTTTTGVGLLVDVEVGAATTTGIGSDTFEVTNFKIARPGYAFRRGDIIRPVGLVTHSTLSSATSEFLLTVDDVYNDTIGAWQFGEFDYIDSIKNFQDGERTRFPLFYNDELISFEAEAGTRVNLANALLIVVNGVIQDPGVAYSFDGGTSFSFSEAPKPEDNIDIFFYRGTRNDDDQLITTINQTIKRGDLVQVYKNNSIRGTVTQDKRTVFDLSFSDKFETNLYSGNGIDETNFKPLAWIKQKVDRVINGEIVPKTRDSIEAQIFPTAKIINTIESSDTEIFVEDADLFDYDSATDFSGLIVAGSTDPVAAALTATVSTAGTITEYTIVSGGSGYTSTPTISVIAPPEIGVGVGTTATATATISNGTVTSVLVNNPGLGYTIAPQVLVSLPGPTYEEVSSIDVIQGFSGIVTGITTVNAQGIGTLAIQFNLHRSDVTNYTDLSVGYPIYIFDTQVGTGVTSVANNSLSVVGVGTTFVDNIYFIQELSSVGAAGSIVCYVDSGTSVVGIATTSNSDNPVGRFSWGRLAGISRATSPVSIAVTGNTVDVGLTTFPTIQRRGIGLRDGGALPKTI